MRGFQRKDSLAHHPGRPKVGHRQVEGKLRLIERGSRFLSGADGWERTKPAHEIFQRGKGDAHPLWAAAAAGGEQPIGIPGRVDWNQKILHGRLPFEPLFRFCLPTIDHSAGIGLGENALQPLLWLVGRKWQVGPAGKQASQHPHCHHWLLCPDQRHRTGTVLQLRGQQRGSIPQLGIG